jgi:hypothetical protein
MFRGLIFNDFNSGPVLDNLYLKDSGFFFSFYLRFDIRDFWTCTFFLDLTFFWISLYLGSTRWEFSYLDFFFIYLGSTTSMSSFIFRFDNRAFLGSFFFLSSLGFRLGFFPLVFRFMTGFFDEFSSFYL